MFLATGPAPAMLTKANPVAPALARTWPVFEQLKFLRSSLGWEGTAGVVREKLAEAPYGALLVNTREMAAEMLYYLRDQDLPLYVWPHSDTPHDHFEMTRPFVPGTPEPILFVSFKPCPEGITRSFREVTAFPAARVRLVRDEARTVYTCRLAGYESK